MPGIRGLSAVLTCGLVAALAAQTAPQTPPPVFRAGVDLIQVDVTVVDKNHQPVRGLSATDFTILEDGRPQAVAAFSAVDLPDPPAVPIVGGRPVTWMRDVALDVQSNSLANGRLVVLLIDDALIPNDPRIVANARTITNALVDRLGPGDRMTVIFTEGSRQAQDFTSDRARLHATVDKLHAGRAVYTFGWESMPGIDEMRQLDPLHNPHPGPDPDAGIRDASFATLQMVSEALLSSPERRKALIYVSPGVPVNAFLAASAEMKGGGQGGVQTVAGREANVRLVEQMPELFRRMQRANIAVYAVDPCGPLGIGGYVEGRIAAIPRMREFNQGTLDPATQIASVVHRCDNRTSLTDEKAPFCYVPIASEFANFITQLSHDFLQTAAANTGGRVIIGTDDFVPRLEEILRENGSYYLLGYRAPAGDTPGHLHRLTVRVNRPGVEVHTRSGYYTPKLEKIDPKKAASPTAKSVAGVLPAADLPLQVALAPIAGAKNESAVLIALGLQLPTRDKPFADSVLVETRAFTPDGLARGVQTQTAYIAVRPGTGEDVLRYEALSSIALKPGRYQLRIGAYSSISDTAGSVFADVEVPDFAKDPLSLSGVLLSATPSVPAQPVEVATRLAPVVPTAARSFQKLDRVMAFTRVYLGGKSTREVRAASKVTMAARILNERGETAFTASESWSGDRFAGTPGAADYRVELPLVTLARGGYLLTIEADGLGVHAIRHVRFTVR